MFGRLWKSKKRILVYHRVLPDDAPAFLFDALSGELVSLSIFRAQFSWMASRYPVRSLAELMHDDTSGFAVTFDDGLVDNLRYAAPVLAELGIPATIFALAGELDSGHALLHHSAARWLAHNRQSDSGESGESRQSKESPREELRQVTQGFSDPTVHPDDRFLESDEVRQLVELGISVQSHGLSHTPLSELSVDEAQTELRESKSQLEALTGQPVDYFAYPIGRESHLAHADGIAAAGYKAAFTAIPGRPKKSQDPYRIPRLGARNSLQRLKKKI